MSFVSYQHQLTCIWKTSADRKKYSGFFGISTLKILVISYFISGTKNFFWIYGLCYGKPHRVFLVYSRSMVEVTWGGVAVATTGQFNGHPRDVNDVLLGTSGALLKINRLISTGKQWSLVFGWHFCYKYSRKRAVAKTISRKMVRLATKLDTSP